MWFSKKNQKQEDKLEALPMAHFLKLAEAEIGELIQNEPTWYENLPYRGGLSRDKAREFEIEKRAVWKRVIHDARREELEGLIWRTRGDGLVCGQCAALEGKVFKKNELIALQEKVMHIGCRCELVPLRR